MPNNLEDLAIMISKRDKISYHEAEELIAICQMDMEVAYFNGDINIAEDILLGELDLGPEYLKLFID